MSVTVAVTRVAAPTSTGNQTITTTDLGGLTPKAALFIATRAITDGAAADGAGWYMGATDGTNEWAQGYEQEHGAANMDEEMEQDTTANRVLTIYDGTADDVVDGAANFVQWETDGITINWADAPAAAYLVTVIFFAGSDLSTHVGTVSLGDTADALIPITSIGFEADVVFTALLEGTTLVEGTLGMGFIHNDRAGAVSQRAVNFGNRNGFASSRQHSVVRGGNCVARLLITETLDWFGTAQTFDSAGFDVQLGNARAHGSHHLGWLALRFGASPVVSSKVYTYSTPTGTGNNTDAGAGFKPQFVIYLPTFCTVADTIETDADGGTIGLAAIDADEAYCNSIQSEDGPTNSNTQSLSDDQAVNLPTDAGAAGMAATFVEFVSTGITLNWSDVETTAKLYPALAIGEVSAQVVNKDLQAIYDIRSLVSKDIAGQWDIYTLVNKDLQAVWDMRALAGKELQALWDIIAFVNKDLQVIYDIIGSAQQVNKDLQAIYDIRSLVNKDLAAQWDVFQLVDKELQGVWDVRALASKDLAAQWDILVLVNKDLQGVWDMRTLASKDLAAVWDIAGTVGKELAALWDIGGQGKKKSKIVIFRFRR